MTYFGKYFPICISKKQIFKIYFQKLLFENMFKKFHFEYMFRNGYSGSEIYFQKVFFGNMFQNFILKTCSEMTIMEHFFTRNPIVKI